jgi:hypothetical protein
MQPSPETSDPRAAPFPIRAHDRPDPSPGETAAAERLAEELLRELPALALPDALRRLVPARLEPGPTLHVDDLTSIRFLDQGREARFYQERARLRAGDGDVVATSLPVAEGYETYCRERLGLGAVEWLHPAPTRRPLCIAEACWEDERVRADLTARLRAGRLAWLHPHMGTKAIWQLALLLSEEAGRALPVIAPPPAVSKWVNDKVAFSRVVCRLFGEALIPRTASACNFALLAQRLQSLSRQCPVVGIKLQDSAGGDGMLVLNSERFLGRRLSAIRDDLKQLLPALKWSGESELLIDTWETEIVCSPSAQVWIPPKAAGEPVVEGLFVQTFAGGTAEFIGSRPAVLPPPQRREIVNRCWLLARLFQRLGYVGRCSFDLILVGPSAEQSRPEFVECNGRWGGTSAPMTLMNRLFGDWAAQPYFSCVCTSAALAGRTFMELLTLLGDDLYDRRTGEGALILSLPGRLAVRTAIDVIALGPTTDAAIEFMRRRFLDVVEARPA